MRLLEKIFKPKIVDKSDKPRLPVVRNEPALREGYNYVHLENVLDAREYKFNETVTIKPKKG